MKSKLLIMMVGGAIVGLNCSMAMAEDCTNKYFDTNASLPITGRAVVLEGAQTTVNGNAVMTEEIKTLPVMMERTNALPVMIEDRVVKQKHFFGIGIWPIFDFEIL